MAEIQAIIKVWECKYCGKELRFDDMAAAVDHMYVAHNPKNDDHAKMMVHGCETKYISDA